MADSIEIDGWKVRLRFRTIKKKKIVKGRTRGRYEGKYVYVRVTGPDKVIRDFYCGRAGAPGAPGANGRGRNARAGELVPATSTGGRSKGQKRSRGATCGERPHKGSDDACYRPAGHEDEHKGNWTRWG